MLVIDFFNYKKMLILFFFKSLKVYTLTKKYVFQYELTLILFFNIYIFNENVRKYIHFFIIYEKSYFIFVFNRRLS